VCIYMCVYVMYVYVYMCVYVCMYTCMCVYVCIYVCTYVSVWMYVCMRVCMHVPISLYMYVCSLLIKVQAEYRVLTLSGKCRLSLPAASPPRVRWVGYVNPNDEPPGSDNDMFQIK